MKKSKLLFRNQIIDDIYRSIRDALNNFLWISRSKNSIIFYKRDAEDNMKKITISFRVKIEDSDTQYIDAAEGLEKNEESKDRS